MPIKGYQPRARQIEGNRSGDQLEKEQNIRIDASSTSLKASVVSSVQQESSDGLNRTATSQMDDDEIHERVKKI